MSWQSISVMNLSFVFKFVKTESCVLWGLSGLKVDSYCVVIPLYNHVHSIASLLARLKSYRLTTYLVDDGSDAPIKKRLASIIKGYGFVHLMEFDQNRGKGSAVCAALCRAFSDGFSHAIQIDADGQYDPADIGEFLAMSKQYPENVVSGFRAYDQMPRGRALGRRLTDVWVAINTLSVALRDSMCGFRVYPLTSTMNLLENGKIAPRMDFDPDVLVKLYWSGVQVSHVPVGVLYSDEIPSHFNPVLDNLRISLMHTRHFFGMLARLPALIGRER